MNTWLLFAILGPLLWGCSNALDSAVRRHFVKNDLAATWLLAVTRLPLIAVIFFIVGLHVPGPVELSIMIFAGFLWLLPFVFYYRAIEFEEPSRVALLMQIIPVIALLLAFFLIRETLTWYQLIAFGLILIGGLFAALKKTAEIWKISRAARLIIFAGFLWALSDVLFKKFEPSFPVFWDAFAFYFSGGSLITLVVFIPSCGRTILQNFTHHSPRIWFLLIINQLIGISGSLAFAYALTLGKVSLTTAFIGVQPLFAFLWGFLLKHFIPELHREDTSARALLFKGTSFILIVIGLLFL